VIRTNAQRFGAIGSRLSVNLCAVGLVAAIATPALAGFGGFNNTGSMNVARFGHTATLLANGEVLVAGGANNSMGFLSSAELYDPSTGKWTPTGSLAVARFGHNAVPLSNGQVLLAGGLDPNACCGALPLATAELYNPSTGAWTATGSMSVGRSSFCLTLLPNGEVLAAGGDNGTSAELYNPTTGMWTMTGSTAAAPRLEPGLPLPRHRSTGRAHLRCSRMGMFLLGAAGYLGTICIIPRRRNGPTSSRLRAQRASKVARVPVRCSLQAKSWLRAGLPT
jgi:galactose oxidase-like protein